MVFAALHRLWSVHWWPQAIVAPLAKVAVSRDRLPAATPLSPATRASPTNGWALTQNLA